MDAAHFDGMNRDDAHYYTFVSSFGLHFDLDAEYDAYRDLDDDEDAEYDEDSPPVELYPEKLSLYIRDVIRDFHDLDYFYFQYKLPRYFMHKDQSWYYVRDIQMVKPDDRDRVLLSESFDEDLDEDFSPVFMGWGFILN